MEDACLSYYKFNREIPDHGEAVTIYECGRDTEGALLVKRFVTHLLGTEKYDCLDVDWTMELVREEVVEVTAEEFEQLWNGCSA